MSTVREVYEDGYRRVCLNCHTVFKPRGVPKVWCEDGHGGYSMEMCRCGCDLIGYIIEGEDGRLYISSKPEITKDAILYE